VNCIVTVPGVKLSGFEVQRAGGIGSQGIRALVHISGQCEGL